MIKLALKIQLKFIFLEAFIGNVKMTFKKADFRQNSIEID